MPRGKASRAGQPALEPPTYCGAGTDCEHPRISKGVKLSGHQLTAKMSKLPCPVPGCLTHRGKPTYTCNELCRAELRYTHSTLARRGAQKRALGGRVACKPSPPIVACPASPA